MSSLRVFVAVAEHLSFTRAAAALGVTVSAASMQVQGLERYLGLPLFRRQGRLVELTTEGAQLLPKVRVGLDGLQSALDGARKSGTAGPIHISMLVSFLYQWMLPRLADFERQHPSIELRIHSSSSMVDFSRSEFHAAVRFGEGPWPGLHAEKLLDEWLVPVCSPAVLERLGPIRSDADLKRFKLVHSQSETWSHWLLGAEGAQPAVGASFDDSLACIRAAEAGGALALGRWSLVASEIRLGRLALAATEAVRFPRAYHFVCPPKYLELEKLNVLRSWLRAQAQAHAPPPLKVR